MRKIKPCVAWLDRNNANTNDNDNQNDHTEMTMLILINAPDPRPGVSGFFFPDTRPASQEMGQGNLRQADMISRGFPFRRDRDVALVSFPLVLEVGRPKEP